MRKMILGLLCAALVAPLAAQQPAVSVAKEPGAIQQVSHLARAGQCCEACPEKVCVPEPTTKKTSRTVFGSKCIDYCLPKCTLGGHCHGCQDDCGPARTKRVLLKKVITDECPDTKCVVQTVAGCVTSAPAAEKVAPPKGSGKE